MWMTRGPKISRGHARHVVVRVRSQYVGDTGTQATQYHQNDFSWNICIEEGEKAIRRQRIERAQLNVGTCNEDPNENKSGDNGPSTPGDNYSYLWEEFHQVHSSGRFFKEKRYLTLEFPMLLSQDPKGLPLHIAEIGCGCGSALLPILKANNTAIATAYDVSRTAIDVFRSVLSQAGVSEERVKLCVHAAGGIPSSSPLNGIQANFILLIFTLSAFHPNEMSAVVSEAFAALASEGRLLFRDYGLYDMAQIRFAGEQLVDTEHLVYQRGDGTYSHFFSLEFLRQLAEETGFIVEEAEYVCTYIVNKKNGKKMRRVFVHGVFLKP